MWNMWLASFLAVTSLVISANGQEAFAPCKEIGKIINRNETTSELIKFNGNITVFAMLNSSLDTCIEKAELLNGLQKQLLGSHYYQVNFVILDTTNGTQPGDRQTSQKLIDAAGNVTVLSNAALNITGWLKNQQDYIIVVNRCGRQVFQMINPCSVKCSDLKTAIFTTFYDNVYQFCGDCKAPYATPIHEDVQNLNPDFYRNIDNCGDWITPDSTTEPTHKLSFATNFTSSEENSAEDKRKMSSEVHQYIPGNTIDNLNKIYRTQNSQESSKENNKPIPVNIHLDLPNIHTVNYKITKHSQIPTEKNVERNVVITEEFGRDGRNQITTYKSSESDEVIDTQYFKKSHGHKHAKTSEEDSENGPKARNAQHQSIEETLTDNIMEFSNGTDIQHGFQLTDRHALFHIYKKMLPKLRELLDQQKSKNE